MRPINYSWTPWYPQGLGNTEVKFPLDLFSCYREEDFWRFYVKNNMAAEPRDRCSHQFFCQLQMSPRWPSKIFILIGQSIWHVQLWYCNEATYIIIKKITVSFRLYFTRAKFQFFSMKRCQRYKGPKFLLFSKRAATPGDLWHHIYHKNILHE